MDASLTLSDGRKLGYGEYGDPKATPLFYCHGYPTNRIEYEVVAEAAEQSGIDVRVVVLNRPGYGSSTFQSGRTLLDWPRDVAEAADHLGIDEFAVLGVSGGGPFALACAAAMPERITTLGLVVGVGPADAPGMDESLILRATVPASVGEWLAGQLPDSDLVVWPDHRHFTWMTSPEAAAAIAATVGLTPSPSKED